MAFFLGLAEANAYKLYTEFATLPLSHRAFRERLVFQMLGSLETQSTGTIPTTSEPILRLRNRFQMEFNK